LYTDELLDVYLGYKALWKDIHNLAEESDASTKVDLAKSESKKPHHPSGLMILKETLSNPSIRLFFFFFLKDWTMLYALVVQ